MCLVVVNLIVVEPQPQELYIDESLTPMEKFVKYIRSDLMVHRFGLITDCTRSALIVCLDFLS